MRTKIALLGGNPINPSRAAGLIDYIGARLDQEQLEVATIHLCDLPIQAVLAADRSQPAIAAALKQVAEADGLVVAGPDYSSAYNLVLKAFLDQLPQGLKGKVVLPLAVAPTAARLLLLDYALRPALASLNPRLILESVRATEQQITWTMETGMGLDPALRQRMHHGVGSLITALPRESPAHELPAHCTFMPMMSQ